MYTIKKLYKLICKLLSRIIYISLFCCPKVLKFMVGSLFSVPLGTLQKYFYTPIGLIQKRKRISYDSLGRGVDDEYESF